MQIRLRKNGWKFCFTCQNDDTLARNRDTLMILFKGYLTMYHYGECSDYQNVVRKVRWNNDTMILFSKKNFSSVNREDSLRSLPVLSLVILSDCLSI